jgi:hypothetical protein
MKEQQGMPKTWIRVGTYSKFFIMPSISNVKLDIAKGTGGSKRKVSVSYTMCFSTCEVLAGSVFTEKVVLRGDDLIWDSNLATIRNSCVKSQKECIDRKFSVLVSRSRLDEDGDTVIFGIPVFAARDEIYARVSLTPFAPSSRTTDSNVVTGQFGAAGSD